MHFNNDFRDEELEQNIYGLDGPRLDSSVFVYVLDNKQTVEIEVEEFNDFWDYDTFKMAA